MLNKSQLHPYQMKIIQASKTIPNLGLFLPPGLGKTTTTLTIIAENFQGKTLIIAPKRVAEAVWAQEALKWSHLKHLRISKVLGTPKQRLSAISTESDIYIVNLENVVWLMEQSLKFQNLVIDESSRFKDSSTKRFKALKKHLRSFKRRIILTGTPTPQGLGDLWAQVGILDLGERLETSLTKFRDKYMQPDQMNRQTRVVYNWKLKPGAADVITKKIEDICFSLKAEDYLALPPLTSLYHSIEIESSVRGKYNELKKDMVSEIKGQQITAPTAAALANKLLQFTSGAVYDEEGNVHQTHDAKVEYLSRSWKNPRPQHSCSTTSNILYRGFSRLSRMPWSWTTTTLKRGVVARFVCFSHIRNRGASGLISSATLETQHKPCGLIYRGAPRTTSKPTLGFIAKGKKSRLLYTT